MILFFILHDFTDGFLFFLFISMKLVMLEFNLDLSIHTLFFLCLLHFCVFHYYFFFGYR